MNDVFMNRELSWLKFNERVLEEAEDERTPLCERLSFASIYQSNLDEFFMVRVGSLVDQDDVTPKLRENKTNMTAREQIDAVIDRVRELNGRRDKVYARLMEKLEEQGVRLVDFRKIGRQESERLERYFDSEIAPLISPSIVGRRQPFPFLLYPKVVGKSVGLPGLLVLMAVTIGGEAFGVMGMLFSVPVCAVLYSLYLEFMKKADAL